MTQVYDNWERLVEATLKRQNFRELALASSRESSFSSSTSGGSSLVSGLFNFHFNFRFNSLPNSSAYPIEQISDRIDLAVKVIKAADTATLFKQNCAELKSKAEKLISLLREVARVNQTLYGQPTGRIMDGTGEVLREALDLVTKCRRVRVWRRVFASIPSSLFDSTSTQIQHVIENLSWLLREDHECFGLPPIAAEEPTLCYTWELIAILHTGTTQGKCDAAASLASLARQDEFYRKLIADEGGIPALLKLLMDGNPDEQENAAKAIGLLLGKDLEASGEILAAVQDSFSIIQDTFSTVHKKETAARALRSLVRGNGFICRLIVADTTTLLSFATILEKEYSEDIRQNCAMALVEITAEAEKDSDEIMKLSRLEHLERDEFKLFVDKLSRLMGKDSENFVVIACVEIVGNLAKILSVKEAWIISQLVRLQADADNEAVYEQVSVAIAKFASYNKFITMQAQLEISSTTDPTFAPNFLIDQ